MSHKETLKTEFKILQQAAVHKLIPGKSRHLYLDHRLGIDARTAPNGQIQLALQYIERENRPQTAAILERLKQIFIETGVPQESITSESIQRKEDGGFRGTMVYGGSLQVTLPDTAESIDLLKRASDSLGGDPQRPLVDFHSAISHAITQHEPTRDAIARLDPKARLAVLDSVNASMREALGLPKEHRLSR